ncbi:MAG: MurR/RpiR family transcriptional regulator [Spirochaetaceae bacterium]|nr:MurR/RpiR family transcriptional regulator [Spirochaetaceae bacterium]
MDNIQENVYNRITNLLPSLNGLAAKIAQYFLDNLDNLKYLRVKQIADNCKVSEATITRFVKTLGYLSFYDFKMAVANYNTPKPSNSSSGFILGDINYNDSFEDIIAKMKSGFLNTIDVTINFLDLHEIKKAISVVSSAKTINIYATGNSFIPAKHAYLRLYRIGKKCNVYVDPSEIAVSASLLTKEDVAIGISYSGKSEPVTKAINYAKEAGATTIAITGPINSIMQRTADIKISTVKREIDDFQISSFSRLSHIVILDIIYAGVAANDYKKSVKAIKVSGTKVADILNN